MTGALNVITGGKDLVWWDGLKVLNRDADFDKIDNLYAITDWVEDWYICPDSVPQISYFWIGDYWSVDCWLKWFEVMEIEYGKEYAVNEFEWWFHNKYTPVSIGAIHTDWRSNNSDFIKFCESNGIDRFNSPAERLLTAPLRVTTSAIEIADKFVSNVGTTFKILTYALPIAVLYFVYRFLFKGEKPKFTKTLKSNVKKIKKLRFSARRSGRY